MQEDRGGLCHGHDFLVDLIRQQQLDALLPQLSGLAHADPDVGVEHVAVLRALRDVAGELQNGAGLGGDSLALGDQLGGRHQLLRSAGAEVHAQLGADDHQGVGNVVARVAEEGQLAAADIAELLADGQDVGQHLGGMEVVGQAVPYGNAGVAGQILNHGLLEAAVLDAVIHAAQNLGGVGQGFLLAHLRRAGIQERNAHAEVTRTDLKRAAGAGRGLLEQQNDLLVGEVLVLHAVSLQALEFGGEIEHIVDFRGGEVELGEEASSSDVYAHSMVPPKQYCDF